MRRIGQIGQIGLIGLIGLIGFIAVAQADISFPVAELGGCGSQDECKSYCDKPDNISACVDFAEQNGLMDEEEAARARAFVAAGSRGPGGCAGQQSCRAYCDDTSHINECLAFAEEHDLMDPEELEEAKKVAAALASGAALPGGCNNKSECDAYCETPAHMEECLLFAEKAGFLSGEELEEARRVAPLIARGETPGGCVRKEQCEAYCSDEANMNECAEFAIKAGFMSAEDAEMYRKTGGKGPGNCRSKESCEAFCDDPQNQEVCFTFAKEHGLISEEEMEMMREGVEQMQEAFMSAPDEVRDCIREKLGEEVAGKIEAGDFMPSREMGDVTQKCFEETIPQEFMTPNQGPGPQDFGEEFRGEIHEQIQDETQEWIERGPSTGSGLNRPPTEEEMEDIYEQKEDEMREQFEGQMREQMYQEPEFEPAPWSRLRRDSTGPTSLLQNSLFGEVLRALIGR